MANGTVGKIVKSSLLYSYVLSQPLAVYVDAYPVLDNKQLLEAEQMQYGEHGQLVRAVQQKLQILSYYDDQIDGKYGILTEHALRNFQKEHQISVSGKVDEKTKKEIIQKEKQKHIDRLEDLSDSVQPGTHNEDVKIIQEALEYFGYYEGEIDGIYGPLTQKGLETAEDEHDIELTDEVTEEALRELYDTETTEEESEENQEEDDDQETEDQDKNDADDAKQDDAETDDAEQDEAEEDDDIKQVEVKKDVNASVAEVAESLLGTPYEWGGETETGFDCSGFIQYVYEEEGITTPRTVSEVWNFGEEVDEPSVGDLVFFETYKPGPSHMGVYTGNGEFIHASESNGVKTSELDESYWEERYLGAKRIE